MKTALNTIGGAIVTGAFALTQTRAHYKFTFLAFAIGCLLLAFALALPTKKERKTLTFRG